MSDPVREDTVDRWNLAIEDGLEFRRQYGREAEWARCESLFSNANEIQRENVGPNLMVSTGDALLSSLLVPNPHIMLKALQPQVLEAVPVLESVLNSFVNALKLKDSIGLSALHAFLYGVGILKIGYDSEFGYNPKYDLGQPANTITGITLTQFDKKGSKIEFSNVTPGMPWVESVLPHDFVVPWGVGPNLQKSPWCAHRTIRHIDDIKADRKYSNTKNLVPQMSMSDWVKSYLTVMKPYRMGRVDAWGQRESSDLAEYVELWEIHDMRTGRVKVISQGYDKFLRNDVDYLQEAGLPFVAMRFVPSPRTFWCTPDTLYLQSAQEEAIDIASIAKKQRRISTMRFLFKEGAMDNDEIEKYLSGTIGIAAKYKEDGSNGQPPIIPISPSNNNQMLQQEADAVRRDSRETVGFGRNQVGEYESTGRRTATEATVVNNNSEQRIDRRQDIVGDVYCEVSKKLSSIVFKFWRTPRVVQVVGMSGAAEWTTFTGQQLKGEYLYQIGFSNEPSDNMQSRKSEAMQIFQMLGQDPGVDPVAIRRFLIRAYNNPEFASLFKPGVVDNANLQLLMQQLQAQLQGNQQGQPGTGQGGFGLPNGAPQPGRGSGMGGSQSPPPNGGGNGNTVASQMSGMQLSGT